MTIKYRGIIFDLDGVICSTDFYHYQAWKKMADDIGVYFDKEINNRLRGISRAESLEIILERAGRSFSQEEKVQLLNQKNSLYREFLQQMTPQDLSRDVEETLVELRIRGVRLAIGSSSKNARTILKRIGLENFFDAVSDGTNISRFKPDPEVFLAAAEMLGMKPEACLVVEDAVAGIQAAAAGGFDSAGIGNAAAYKETTWPLLEISDILKL